MSKPTDQELIDAIGRFETAAPWDWGHGPSDPSFEQAEAELGRLLDQTAQSHEQHDPICHHLAVGCTEGVEWNGRVYAPSAIDGHVVTIRRVRRLGDQAPCTCHED